MRSISTLDRSPTVRTSGSALRAGCPWLRALAALLASLVLADAAYAQVRVPREPSARPGSCDGVIDYAHELVPSAFQLLAQSPTVDGRVRVELSADVTDTIGARFAAASAIPDLVGHEDLGVVEDSVWPAEFDAVPTNGTASSVATLSLELPEANVGELLARLADGRIQTTVHADEEPVVREGVRFAMWSGGLDLAYGMAEQEFGDNRWNVTGDGAPSAPPYEPGAQYTLVLRLGAIEVSYPTLPIYDGNGETVESLDALIDELCPSPVGCVPAETVYLIAGSDALWFVPEAAHFVRILGLSRGEIPFPPEHVRYDLLVDRSDADDIESIYESASFCTSDTADVDDPVQVTRLERESLLPDLQPILDRQRDEQGQPIRFNGIDFGGVTVSGQVAGHVLKPRLQVQVRPGRKKILASLDTELSLTAEIRAGVGDDVSGTQPLYDLCFPLPSLPMGPATLNLNLELRHDVSLEGGFAAGAVVGFQKRFEAGVTVGYDSAAPDPLIREHRHGDAHPVEFTPPTLGTALGAGIQVGTDLRATLRMGAAYPYCNTGVGAFLNAHAYGALDVTPLQTPVWRMHHGAELTGGLNLELLGFPLLALETDPLFAPGADERTGGAPAAAAAAARSLHAPAAAAPAAIGSDQRWARAYEQILDPNGIVSTAILALPDGGARVLASQGVSGSHVLRIDRHGEILSRVRYDPVFVNPVGLVVLPDGGFAVLDPRG
nr:hypothetical protein [Myxococcota bacterium]